MFLSLALSTGCILLALVLVCPCFAAGLGLAAIARYFGFIDTALWLLAIGIIADIVRYYVRAKRPPPRLIVEDFNRYNCTD